MSRAAKPCFQMFNLEDPATLQAIEDFQLKAGFALPGAYAEFLKSSNGGWGEIGEHYLQLWPVEELLARNEGYDVAECAPGLLLFGSDGGGEAFAFDRQRPGQPVVMVPFIPLDRSDAIDIAPGFDEFLDRLYRGPGLWGEDPCAETKDEPPEDLEGVEPYIPGQPGLWTLANIAVFVDQCRDKFEAAQANLEKTYGIASFDRYRYALGTGRLDLLTGNETSLSFHTLPIGSWSPADFTWRWAWGDQAIPAAVAAQLSPLAELAKDDEWLFYDRPQYKARSDDAWFMAALALERLGGLGAYRIAETPQVFLLLTALAADNR